MWLYSVFLGNGLCKAGHYFDCEENFLKAVELEPNNPTFYSNLGKQKEKLFNGEFLKCSLGEIILEAQMSRYTNIIVVGGCHPRNLKQ